MKKIIICLMLLIFSSISFAEFDYSKGMTFNKCKVKIYSVKNFLGCSSVLETEINGFCNNKMVFDIKFQETVDFMSVIIIYRD